METADNNPVRLPAASVPLQSGRTIFALMLREMGTTYGRSPGGYVWALLEPIGMIAILSLAFSLIVRAPSLGTSFILFYATGFLPFMIYSNQASKIVAAISFSRALLSYPSVTWLDAVLARFLLTFLTGASVVCILLTGILKITGSRVILDVVAIITALGLAALIGLGIGMINCILNGFFPVWKSLWGIISRPLFIASGVLFIIEDMPVTVQKILWWNPLIHVTGLMRTGVYSTYHGSYISLPYTLGFALVLIASGLLFLRAYNKSLLEI